MEGPKELSSYNRMIIYALMSGALILYIGKTSDIAKRRREHHCKTNGTASRKIPNHIDWEIVKIDECTDAEAPARERHWYETLKPLYNERYPNRGKQEYDHFRYLQKKAQRNLS